MGLSSTVSQTDGDFSRKSQNFPTAVNFAPPREWVPLGIGTSIRVKKRMMGLPGRERSLTISSAVWIQYANVTDGQRACDSKDRAYS